MLLIAKLTKNTALFKSFGISLVPLAISVIADAQRLSNFQPFGVGAGYGVTIAFAGEKTLTSSNALTANLNYNVTPFVTVSAEVQAGQLTSGDALRDLFAKQFINDYKAVFLHADVQLGEFIDYSHNMFLNGIKNIYAGTGFGVLLNQINQIQTVNPIASQTAPLTYAPKSTNVVVPLRLGYEFKIFNRYDEPQIRFDLGYSFNTAFGHEGLDGYVTLHSGSVKFYNYFSAGFKYSFGDIRAYHKPVSYSDF